MKENILQQKSYRFALNIVKASRTLMERNEYVLSRQLLKSGTSIGANVEEAIGGHSRREFHHKLSIAYREARETNYWLKLLRDSHEIDSTTATDLIEKVEELLKILGSILKTLQNSQR